MMARISPQIVSSSCCNIDPSYYVRDSFNWAISNSSSFTSAQVLHGPYHFNFGLVLLNEALVLLGSLLLHDGGQYTPRCTTRANDVLVRYGE